MIVSHGLVFDHAAPSAVTIGNFDGLHLGHQALLAQLRTLAAADGLRTCVLTFEPHPREFFAPEQAPTRLTSLREKCELLAEFGIDHTHVLHFDAGLAAMSADAFVEQVLVAGLQAQQVLIGDDFRYGSKRAGDFAHLQATGARLGFGAMQMQTVRQGDARASSTAVREALAAGDMARARALLGRWYGISGRVVHGAQRGRTLGFPTANVEIRHNRPPCTGVFAVRVHGAGDAPLPGVANLGRKPTVAADAPLTLETHLLDWQGDLYNAHLRVELLHRIRDERKFESLDALTRQIAADCEAARVFHAGAGLG
ncbi:MAG: bifunctional riboflavin kinase/FAD synthetase [Rhodocyclaceae bacterium]|nr:bifunctional riboflavin kinase/FAD synthetase [Rhodocyclaceae bacterium]